MQSLDVPPQDLQSIEALEGARLYLAIPEHGQRWQMAIYDFASNAWRAVSYSELQRLARQMGHG